MKKKVLDVLFQDDLEDFLINIGFSDDFKKGKIKCYCCNENISMDNICAVMIKKSDEFVFICNKESCYENYLKAKEE